VLRRDIIIVGSGPAGAATALGIAARDPALAAGRRSSSAPSIRATRRARAASSRRASAACARSGSTLDVPHAPVDDARVDTPRGRVDVADRDLCRVVRPARARCDARVGRARSRRRAPRGQRVLDLARDGDGIRVTTDDQVYWARAVVGADGSGSHVRRALVPGDGGIVARAVMTDVPVRGTTWSGSSAGATTSTSARVPPGSAGYRWVFPCVIDGVPHANVGRLRAAARPTGRACSASWPTCWRRSGRGPRRGRRSRSAR
jgi:2-polyprenyl-6-methoxyphenol hydroxylase-like FAD-dependent oxidoreductase